MTIDRKKRQPTTVKEMPRAKRGSILPRATASEYKITVQDVPAISAGDVPTQPEMKLPMKSKGRATNKPPPLASAGGTRRDALTIPEIPAAKHVAITLAGPDPEAARYSVIPKRASGITKRFPTLTPYLESLPQGLGSFPNLSAKGALARRLLLDPVHSIPLGAGLPAQLEELVGTPPSSSDWIPLVHLSALHAAVFDCAFADKDPKAYDEWCFDRSLGLFRSPPYRALIAVSGAERLLVNYGARWAAFHRGSKLEVREAAKGRARLRLVYPPHAWAKISRDALAAALRAAVVVAGSTAGEVTWAEESKGTSSFDVRWS
jgi:hypothetical protein